MDRKAERLGSLAEALNAAWAVREDFLKEVTSKQNCEEEEKKVPDKERRVRIGCRGGKFGTAGPQIV